MDLLIGSNDRYVMPTLVMLASFFASNEPEPGERHSVYMLESELSEDADARVSRFVEERGGRYVRVHVSAEWFASSRTLPYISRETYYRLLAGQLLPQTLKRVLWLDSDMIVRRDIRAFYDTDLSGFMAAACGYGPAMQDLIYKNAKTLGLKHPESYFNAGVVLLDLNECRAQLSEETIAETASPERTQDLMFPGQDVMNLLFDGRTKICDYRLYNCMIHCISTAEDLTFAKEHAAIVHFPGEAKPWKFNDIHFADEWAEFYRECFGPNAPLRRMSYFRLKALYEKQQRN